MDGHISYRFRDKRAISVENRKFFLPHVYLTPPVKGFPMQLGIGVRDQKARMMRLYTGPRKTFDDIISHLDTIHERDGWTDGQRRTDCGKDRAYAQSQKPDS